MSCSRSGCGRRRRAFSRASRRRRGAPQSWTMVLIVPLAFLIGLCFAGLGLIMTAMAKSYDFAIAVMMSPRPAKQRPMRNASGTMRTIVHDCGAPRRRRDAREKALRRRPHPLREHDILEAH